MGVTTRMTLPTIIRTIMGTGITSMTVTNLTGASSGRPRAWCEGAGQRLMRGLAIASVTMTFLAPATPVQAQSAETRRAEDDYRECLYSKSKNGRYAHDDRESDFGLLGECRNQWVAYMDVCNKAGFDNRTCVMKSRLVIHAILNLTGK
jgi:hypothetical protein